MKVRCPECDGRGWRNHAVTPPPLAVSNKPGDTVFLEASYHSEMRDCDRCKGSGSVAPYERVPVIQDGVRVGTLPPTFDPAKIKSTSFMYSPRPNDFREHGNVWVADPSLGPGDLGAVPGFRFG